MALIVSEGRAAIERLKAHGKRLVEDWIKVGDALIVGRNTSMAETGSNSCYGPRYQKHHRRWLDGNGFSDLDIQERRGAIFMAEHKAEIMPWHEALPDVARRNCNHPNTVLAHWRAGTIPQKSGPKPRQNLRVSDPEMRVDAMNRQKPIGQQYSLTRPSQDLIRRIADRMRLSGKRDWLALAVVAVEALTVEDLRDLLPARARPAQLVMELRAWASHVLDQANSTSIQLADQVSYIVAIRASPFSEVLRG
jgi:hypothetical protein